MTRSRSLTQSINAGLAFLHSGQPGKAAEHYKKILYRFPNEPEALHLLAVAVYQLGDPDRAIGYARRATKANPKSADYLSNLGRYYLAKNLTKEAVCALTAARELNGSHAMSCYNLALALIAEQKPDEALTCLRDFVRLEPLNPSGHMSMGNLYAQLNLQQEAAQSFRTVLSINSTIAEAHNNLGNSLLAQGSLNDALACYDKALALRSNYSDALSNKGAALQSLGKREEARKCFEQALRIDPQSIQARGNLANLLGDENRHAEAIALYQQILDTFPESVETWNNLGNCYQQLGQHTDALSAYHHALRLRPAYYLVHNNIGNTLRKQGKYDEAIGSYRTALDADPCFVEAMNNLGVALQDKGCLVEAVQWFEKALSIRPEYPDPLINLANNWRDRGRAEQAIHLLRKALEIAPNNPHTWNNLGCALGDQGLVSEAITCYQKTLQLAPGNHLAHSNLLLNLHYTMDASPQQIFEAHLNFARIHERPRSKEANHYLNVLNPDRPLRIGYVSADFRRHSVAYFVAPILENHDRQQYIPYLYADVARPDSTTDQFQKLAGSNWLDIRGWSSDSLDRRVRQDQIDILVDLGGHTANSRLLDFSGRPAPIQVTWLGYPDTSGLQCIDYRITDEFADPPGQTEQYHSEKLWRLQHSFLCFRPPEDSPKVSELPCLKGEPFTFGSFNNCAKISRQCLEMWAEILKRVPHSRLAIKNKALSETEARERLIRDLAELGIPQSRIYMAGLIDNLSGHLTAYNIVDVALDSWPYHGTTTTLEAIWMGVPVVSLIGDTHVSRVGLSLLRAVGAEDLASRTPQDYVKVAVSLSQNHAALALRRAGMRRQLEASPLMDEQGFTRRLESAFRGFWQTWCSKKRQEAGS